MTQLSMVANNHIHIECLRCHHAVIRRVGDLLPSLPPDITFDRFKAAARCTNCKQKGQTDLRLLYMCSASAMARAQVPIGELEDN